MQDLHGGNIFRHPVTLDVSANINPLGLPEGVRLAVEASAPLWERYPDPDCTALCSALSQAEQIPPERIVCGNGADDLLFRMAAAFAPKQALLAEPCFGEYRRALEGAGCLCHAHLLSQAEDFALTERILPRITPELDLLLLCTPNNPTGRLIPEGLLRRIAERCEHCGVQLVLDACFLPLTEAHDMPLPQSALVLKAFTKSHAMPGLRLGYALCPNAETAERLRGTGQFWSVSAPAQAAGIAAVQETAYLAQARALLTEERRFLTEGLKRCGCRVFPSDANFLLFQSLPELAERLLAEGILLRSCGNFRGLDERYFRTAVRSRAENEALLSAVRRCLHG